MDSGLEETILMWARQGMSACDVEKILQAQAYKVVCKEIKQLMAQRGFTCLACEEDKETAKLGEAVAVTPSEPQTTSTRNSKTRIGKGPAEFPAFVPR